MAPESKQELAAKKWVGQTIAGYRLTRLLGCGGMGAVLEGVAESKLRRGRPARVAVKLLHEQLAAQSEPARRFRREAKATAKVSHPGLVQVLEYGQTPNGSSFIVMEFLEGETLRAYLSRQGNRLPQRDALIVAWQVALALTSAHSRGVVHRDLKPENIILVPAAKLPLGVQPKVVDFGIARIVESTGVETITGYLTAPGSLLGSPRYMSPEQCRGGVAVTDRADTYSLGVLLFELLTGQPPFVGVAVGDLIAKHILEPPPSLAPLAPMTPLELEQLILRMLGKEPAARPPMKEVARKVEGFLDQQATVQLRGALQPTIAVPLLRRSRFHAFRLRRDHALWSAGLAGVLLLVTAIIVGLLIRPERAPLRDTAATPGPAPLDPAAPPSTTKQLVGGGSTSVSPDAGSRAAGVATGDADSKRGPPASKPGDKGAGKRTPSAHPQGLGKPAVKDKLDVPPLH